MCARNAREARDGEHGDGRLILLSIPRQRAVLILANPMSNLRPMGLDSYRAEFFKDRYRVIEVETLAELESKMLAKKRAR